MTRTRNGRAALPKTVAVALGTCLAIGLTLAAPVHAASPGAAAKRIAAHVRKSPAVPVKRHHRAKHHAGTGHRAR